MTTTKPKIMHKGVLYTIFDFIVCKSMYLNLAYGFRWLAERTCKLMGKWWPLNAGDTTIRLINCKRNAADIYIILKWIFILWITFQHFQNNVWLVIKWYFILANLQSFFFHFIWKEQKMGESNINRLQRRMLHLFLAIFFSHLVFAGIYRLDYCDNFDWQGGASFYKSVLFSISNSFAGNYEGIKVQKDPVNTVLTIQFLISFIFVGVIIGKAIPDYGKSEDNQRAGDSSANPTPST